MNEIEGKVKIVNPGAEKFLELFNKSGDLLKNASEFPRIEDETPASYVALIDYYLLGSGRGYAPLVAHYDKQESPPTKSVATLRAWSHRYNWSDRIGSYEEQVAARQLAVIEQARMQFLGKQVSLLFMMEEALQNAFPHIDYEDVNIAQFSRAIEKFADTTQKVFNMTPTVRITEEQYDERQPFRHLNAEQGLNQLSVFTKMIKERNQLEEIVEGEFEEAEDVVSK